MQVSSLVEIGANDLNQLILNWNLSFILLSASPLQMVGSQ
jgi:hypothetical protein